MKVLDPGHQYGLTSLDASYDGEYEFLAFVKRVGPEYPGNTGFPYSGTNIQEVIRALIDRVNYLEGQVPCMENALVIEHLRCAFQWLERRAARRHQRPTPKFTDAPELMSYCSRCHHVGCVGGCICVDHPKEQS